MQNSNYKKKEEEIPPNVEFELQKKEEEIPPPNAENPPEFKDSIQDSQYLEDISLQTYLEEIIEFNGNPQYLEKMKEKMTAINEKLKEEQNPTIKKDGSHIPEFFIGRFKNGKNKSKKAESTPNVTSTKIESEPTSGNNNESRSGMSQKDIEQNAKILSDPKLLELNYMRDDWESMNLKEAKVKLIITALSLKETPSVLKDKLSKWAGIGNLGAVHTAIQIGPIILEWNDSGIIIPAPSYDWPNYRVLGVLDMGSFPVEDFRRDFIPKICEKVTEWNGSVDYDKYKSNCQKFSEEILDTLGKGSKQDKKIENFLDSLGTLDPKDLKFKFQFQNTKKNIHNSFRTRSILCYK